ARALGAASPRGRERERGQGGRGSLGGKGAATPGGGGPGRPEVRAIARPFAGAPATVAMTDMVGPYHPVLAKEPQLVSPPAAARDNFLGEGALPAKLPSDHGHWSPADRAGKDGRQAPRKGRQVRKRGRRAQHGQRIRLEREPVVRRARSGIRRKAAAGFTTPVFRSGTAPPSTSC